mmetsp:Transcript_1416/g.2922  ORF Transcript_1416/g.2922 Transcript_1416/m.2922 type:complete len:495 (-) Transcript_1416:10-1494(-)
MERSVLTVPKECLKVGVTSFDAFMYYVVRVEVEGREVCDAGPILQRECFETWLDTRRVVPSNPEDSYRRTIIAHVTGTKKRRPFPPEVEADLLRLLRIRAVWPCFENRTYADGKEILIGRSGFRATGFHERQTLREKRDLSIIVPQRNQTELEVGKEVITSSLQSDNLREIPEIEIDMQIPSNFEGFYFGQQDQECFDPSENGLITWFIDTMTSELKRHRPEVGGEEVQAEPVSKRRVHNAQSKILQTMLRSIKEDPRLRESMERCKSTWRADPEAFKMLVKMFGISHDEYSMPVNSAQEDPQELTGCWLALHQDSQASTFLGNIVKLVVHTAVPSTIQLLQEYYGTNMTKHVACIPDESRLDPRLQSDFRICDEATRPFDPRAPIGQCIFDRATLTYLRSSTTAKEIMGGDITSDVKVWQISKSIILWWMSFHDIIPLLYSNGSAYFQTVTKRLDGTVIIVRCKYTLHGQVIRTKFQDISHLYPELLELPYPM